MKVTDRIDHCCSAELLERRQACLQQVIDTLEAVPPCFTVSGSNTLHRVGELVPCPSATNEFIRGTLVFKHGWRKEFELAPRRVIDFLSPGHTGMEVQLGHRNYIGYDVLKLVMAYDLGLIDMGVLVVPSRPMAMRMNGPGHVDHVRFDLGALGKRLDVPLVVLAIEPVDLYPDGVQTPSQMPCPHTLDLFSGHAGGQDGKPGT